VIAVDWSGDARAARKTIWLAELRDARVIRLEAGRNRSEVTGLLLAEAERDPDLVVGLDFAFSLPAWYLAQRGIERATDAWELVEREGEEWLSNPAPPFWRKSKPQLAQTWFRRTELDVRRPGVQPKSVFQLGGHGQVGTSSLRGMPFLLLLRECFAIWPFDEPRLPLLVEIYPRAFASAFGHRVDAALNDHARDALVSAHALAAWPGDWTRLPRDSRYELEGRIWDPVTVK
jgi:hypothetical protein